MERRDHKLKTHVDITLDVTLDENEIMFFHAITSYNASVTIEAIKESIRLGPKAEAGLKSLHARLRTPSYQAFMSVDQSRKLLAKACSDADAKA